MLSPTVERGIGIVLVVLGIITFGVFGLMLGSPGDVGVYALAAVPVVLGLGAIWRASSPKAN